ncbi:MAG: ATPase [Sphingomonadales bacterium]|nr:ATPase [Sphingomonadales bacterium]
MTGGKYTIAGHAPASLAPVGDAATQPEAPTGEDVPGMPAPDFSASLPGDASEYVAAEAWDDAAPAHRAGRAGSGTWTAVATAVLGLGWTAWFITANLPLIVRRDPAALSGLVGAWAAPVMLLAVLWLIVQRSSRRESGRFLDAARALSEESARLEARLTVTNQELSLAREFIAAQSRDLEAVGRVAVERLSEHAGRLATLIQDNGARVDAIGSVSASALENMERLRGQLPVITSAAKDVTNHIGNAGRTAQAQLQELIAGFNRLNTFGQASERQVLTLRARFDEILSEFGERSEAIDHAAAARAEALAQGAAGFQQTLLDHQAAAHTLLDQRAATLAQEITAARDALDQAEAEGLTSLRARLNALRDESAAMSRSLRDGEAAALDDWRTALSGVDTALEGTHARIAEAEAAATAAAAGRVAALGEALADLERQTLAQAARLDAEAGRRLVSAEAAEQAAVDRLGTLLGGLDAEIARRRAAHEATFAALAQGSETARAGLDSVEDQIAAVASAGQQVEVTMAARLVAIGNRIEQARAALAETEATIVGLTDNSVRLLELIQAGARHSGHDLVNAIDKGDKRLQDIEARARSLNDSVVSMHGLGAELSEYVLQSQDRLGQAGTALTRLHDELDARTRSHGDALAGLEATLSGLRQSLATLDSAAGETAARAQGELATAIAALEAAARSAVAGIEQHGTQAIAAVASRLGEDSGAAIEKTLRLHMAEVGGRLEQAAAHASGISREATVQLRDQLAKVNELIGHLEARVTRARARAEEQVDNDFSRRAALITESLNSSAIDIAKALDTDVSDSAWSSYLKGDRGIFTRRAVRLLETGEAKAIAQLYENDRDFREHVSHYIHDFEAMLRQLLSTRDGHALGVTLLSSDMGKLYVAMAQSIERLRA